MTGTCDAFAIAMKRKARIRGPCAFWSMFNSSADIADPATYPADLIRINMPVNHHS
jgi:hypothetical protein